MRRLIITSVSPTYLLYSLALHSLTPTGLDTALGAATHTTDTRAWRPLDRVWVTETIQRDPELSVMGGKAARQPTRG